MVLEQPPQQQYEQHQQDVESNTPTPPVARRKFAKPPVKVACLTCRASRTRCDGQEPCSSCASKGRSCSYLPSKRGGPRKKKTATTTPTSSGDMQGEPWNNPVLVPAPRYGESDEGMFTQIDPMALPGAGLRHLDFPSDVQGMFEGLFIPREGDQAHGVHAPAPASVHGQPAVRAYGSEAEVLNAYYDFVHNYFPVLPPRVTRQGPDHPLETAGTETESISDEITLVYQPRSPLSLAISAILALVPHPNDRGPSNPNSILLRRAYAQNYAHLATSMIEEDSELIDSSTEPSQALTHEQPSIDRQPFHPRVPVELESILALLILCIYEYTQRGNLMKMRYRAGQALVMAMNMSLHALGPENDEFSEARRRAWWMTYYCVLQGSISSTTAPTIMINDPRFITPYPHFVSDPEGWSILMQAQQVLVTATQFTIELNRCLKSRSNMQFVYEQMKQLDAWAMSAMAQANTHPTAPPSGHPDSTIEFNTTRSIRAIARIKIASAHIKTHRFRAFSDIPIFVRKHCDLSATGTSAEGLYEHIDSRREGVSLSCQCHNFDVPSHLHGGDLTGASAASTSTPTGHGDTQYCWLGPGFPFSGQYSSKVCLRAALIISHMFQSLPYPTPYSAYGRNNAASGMDPFTDPSMLDPHTQLPRTMPSFACCAMQSSYALLMLFYKMRVGKPMPLDADRDDGVFSSERLLDELRLGLERLIGAVRNYSRAFEALDGMREEIEAAFQTAFA